MWYETTFAQKCAIQYPVVQAGMAGNTTPELVAAVSDFGGLGTIGAGYMSPETLEEEILKVQSLTSKPFAVNLFVPEHVDYSNDDVAEMNEFLASYRAAFNLKEPVIGTHDYATFEALVELVIKHEVPVCSFTFGLPSESIRQRLSAAGILLIGSATTVEEAKAIEAAGLDFIVAQGGEAGGHRASFHPYDVQRPPMIGTMALVPQIVDAVNIPVIASGGVMDGRGWAASHLLGAQGVQLGTAFLTTHESKAKKVHKQAIWNSKETDTVVVHELSGKPARGIENTFIQNLQQAQLKILPYPIQNDLTQTIRATAGKEGKKEWMHLWSGQNVRGAQDVDVVTLMTQMIHTAQSQIEQLKG